ncbi:MAG: M14 family zinc carboxypeptidase [Planctomycetota bacterium]|jgi:PKD repeat protein
MKQKEHESLSAGFHLPVLLLTLLCFVLVFPTGCSRNKKRKPFLFPAEQASNPDPADGATDVSVNAILSWNVSSFAESYDVYFGPDASAISAADEASPEYITNATAPTSTPPGVLNYETTYYWRVDARNLLGATRGNVWSFTTTKPPVSITITTSIGAGTHVLADNTSRAAPYVVEWTQDSVHTIGVVSPQSGGTGIEYEFDSWSDGGARTHAITAADNATYTANLLTRYFLDITLSTPQSPARGLVMLNYEILDNEARTANIVFEFSLNGGTDWLKPSLVCSDAGQLVDNVIIGVPCQPVQETHTVIWDSVNDAGFVRNENIRIRARAENITQGSWSQTGTFTVDNSPPAGAPKAIITADKTCIQSGEQISFSALGSTGSISSYNWQFGDGGFSTETEPVHNYDTGSGEFSVRLTVADSAGLSDTASMKINVTEPISDYRARLEPYSNYAETRALLGRLAEDNPDIMSISTIGYSVWGREIYAVKISDNVQLDEDEPVVHFDAHHHAREIMTPEVIIDICQQLVAGYGSISEVTDWINNYEIFLIPCVNPDGAVAVFEIDWNIRKNANGVDLNRNYPADWGNPLGSDDDPDSSTYHGPFPASEPEVQTVMAQVLGTRPAVAINFHSHSNIILYPYGSPGLVPTSQDTFLYQFGNDIASAMTRDIGGPYECYNTLWYDASGTTQDWMYRDIGTFCVLVEVGNSFDYSFYPFHPDYGDWRDLQVLGVRGGVMEFFRYVGRGAICGHVTDMDTGELLEAEISISGFDKPNSEIRRSEPDLGSYYWLWEDGNCSITFTHEGYHEQSFDITVAGVPFVLDVELAKDYGANHRPNATFTTSMTKFEVGTTIFLDATQSTDEDGDMLTFLWYFGDNETSTSPYTTHTFNRTGTHRIVLTVDDGMGSVHETWKLVHVMPESEAPHVTILPVASQSGYVTVDYAMSIPDPDDVSVSVEYTLDGLAWYPATITGADEGTINGNIIENIWTTDTPASHDFTWDSSADLGSGSRSVILKIKPFISGQIYGDPAITNPFTVSNP